jgi:predicted dinucleotide-utilizing enzyme
MRLLGLIVALGAIGWMLYQAAGGDSSEGAIPASYQQSMEKAKGVEQTVQDAAQLRLEAPEREVD